MKCFNQIILCVFLLLPLSIHAQTQSYKRGVAYDIPYVEDLTSLSPGVSWFYNWGTQPSSAVINQFEEAEIIYVPMTWNNWYDRNSLRSFLEAHPSAKYLLAFNEPNFRDQANMTPSEAAAAWPELEAIADEFNLKLVSPAPNWCGWCVEENGTTYHDPLTYLEDFLEACVDCRVDYIGIHYYMGDVNAIKGSIERLRSLGKPIWLTEFNMDKNGAGDNGTADEQRNFIVNVLDYLEQEPLVYRYSWFIPRSHVDAINLLENNQPGVLTDLGKVYVHMSSYDNDFYHQVNTVIEAEHYIKMNDISLIAATDASGNIAVGYVGTGSWIEYNVEIPETGDYYLNLRVASDRESVVEYYIDDIKGGEFDLPSTYDWIYYHTVGKEISLPAGKHKLKFLFTSGSSNINWFTISDSPEGLSNILQDAVTLYPDTDRNKLHLNSLIPVSHAVVYDMQGRKITALAADNEQTVDISRLPAGLYTVQFFSGEKQLIGKKLFNKQ
ncbi:MAG: glycosyl hydrolase [Candidatus Azobacteroides sp.]|nr:glycosyl hydrolase [Candidatus Azobacteroides sp.]